MLCNAMLRHAMLALRVPAFGRQKQLIGVAPGSFLKHRDRSNEGPLFRSTKIVVLRSSGLSVLTHITKPLERGAPFCSLENRGPKLERFMCCRTSSQTARAQYNFSQLENSDSTLRRFTRFRKHYNMFERDTVFSYGIQVVPLSSGLGVSGKH